MMKYSRKKNHVSFNLIIYEKLYDLSVLNNTFLKSMRIQKIWNHKRGKYI